MISEKEVQHIAKLARLAVTKKEEGKFQKDLSKILDYIEKLKKVNITGTLATSQPLLIKNITRTDEAQQQQQDLLAAAPETKDNYIKVKSILR